MISSSMKIRYTIKSPVSTIRNGCRAEDYHFASSIVTLYWPKLIRDPYQPCAEMLSLLRTPTEQLKWTSKRKKPIVKAVKKRVRGSPEPGAPAPATGHSPRILFLTAFTINFLRFEVLFRCSVGVPRINNTSRLVGYGWRTNPGYLVKIKGILLDM